MTTIQERVRQKYSSNITITKCVEEAIQSLTYESDASDQRCPLLEALRYDDKEAIGKMIADRVYTMLEAEVISELAYDDGDEDDDDYVNHLVRCYEHNNMVAQLNDEAF